MFFDTYSWRKLTSNDSGISIILADILSKNPGYLELCKFHAQNIWKIFKVNACIIFKYLKIYLNMKILHLNIAIKHFNILKFASNKSKKLFQCIVSLLKKSEMYLYVLAMC